MAVVVERLSVGSPLRGLPRKVAARLPAVVDRRRSPTTRLRPPMRAREQGREFARDVAARLTRYRDEHRASWPAHVRDRHRAARSLVVGGTGLAGGGAGRSTRRRGPSTDAEQSAGRARAGTSRAAVVDLGEGKDRRTWDSPAVADLTWATRRLELRAAPGDIDRRPSRPGRSSAPRGSCSRSRRATGRSSTTDERRATTRSSVSSITRGPCSRP